MFSDLRISTHYVGVALQHSPIATSSDAYRSKHATLRVSIFLNPNRHVNVPLEATYLEAWKGMPGFWRNVVVGNPAG
jgi:hypothetical protein